MKENVVKKENALDGESVKEKECYLVKIKGERGRKRETEKKRMRGKERMRERER